MARPRKEPQESKPEDVSQAVYTAYVHGESVNELSARYKLDVQEVLGMIVTIEQNRKLESN